MHHPADTAGKATIRTSKVKEFSVVSMVENSIFYVVKWKKTSQKISRKKSKKKIQKKISRKKSKKKNPKKNIQIFFRIFLDGRSYLLFVIFIAMKTIVHNIR